MSPITKDTVVVSLNAPTHFPIKLTTTNFAVWSRQVQAALIGLDLLSYIDGSLSPPARFIDNKNTQPNDLYSIWHRQDQILVVALLGSCSDQIKPTVASAASARDIWLRLSNAYASTTPSRVLFLKAKLAHNPKGARSIVDYLKDMSDISDALTLAGSPVSDANLIASIITQLDDEYRSVYSALRVRETSVSLAELSDILQDIEHLVSVAPEQPHLIPSANHTRTTSQQPFQHGESQHTTNTSHQNGRIVAVVVGLVADTDETEASIEELNPDLQLKGPMTRSRAQKLQGYMQCYLQHKLEEDGVGFCQYKLVNLSSVEDGDSEAHQG